MYDVAIVGAGLSGLALAKMLEAQGLSVLVLEARERLGGRILTEVAEENGLALDLGPAWFWPHRQPLITELVQRLDIEHFPQRDDGDNLSLADPERGAEQVGSAPVHDGAHRVAGGMSRLVEALASSLEKTEAQSGHVVQAIRDEGSHVQIRWACADGAGEALAKVCVLAMPPRLVASLTFSPMLDTATVSAMQGTATWMATAAKAGAACATPLWRDAGLSGSAFVSHEQAVLAEVWDSCDAEAKQAGLAGFLALSPRLRKEFSAGLPMLIANQFGQLFGPELDVGELHYRDWAEEPFTCSAEDLAQGPDDHPRVADSLLRAAHWGGRLYFAGAETASRDPGYLEGALESAMRVSRSIRDARELSELISRPVNSAALQAFADWVETQEPVGFAVYRTELSRSLMKQDREQLTQRALVAAVETVFASAVNQLSRLGLDSDGARVEQERSSLLPAIQAPFKGFLDALLDEVFAFNATSCALSNFPDEHKPPREYRNAMLRDVAAVWAEFSRNANTMLVEAQDAAPLRQGAGERA